MDHEGIKELLAELQSEGTVDSIQRDPEHALSLIRSSFYVISKLSKSIGDRLTCPLMVMASKSNNSEVLRGYCIGTQCMFCVENPAGIPSCAISHRECYTKEV
jgi:hypothetical protein